MAAGLALVGLLITMPPFTPREPLRRSVNAMMRVEWVRRTGDLMRRWPDAPALLTLVLASIIAVTSMWTRDGAADVDPRYWVHGVMALTAVTMVAFAFATGSVLAPRPFARLERIDDRELRFSLVAGRPWARVATSGKDRTALGTVVGLDTDPRWKALRDGDWVGDEPHRRRDVEQFAQGMWKEHHGA